MIFLLVDLSRSKSIQVAWIDLSTIKQWYLKQKDKYPFIIANTDSSDKGGTYWWNILDIELRTDLFFFYTFGVDSLQNFIIQNEKKVIETILFGTEKLTILDGKITLLNVKFSLNACKNLSKNELENLTDTAIFFILFSYFEISLNFVIL